MSDYSLTIDIKDEQYFYKVVSITYINIATLSY